MKSNSQQTKPLSWHTHETRGICFISPNFSINKNMSLHQDGNDLTVCESILQSVPQNKDQWQTFPGFVRPR